MNFLKITCILLLLVTPVLSNSQTTFFDTTNEIKFENSSEERVIEAKVSKNTFQLDIMINSVIQKGQISLEIIHPESGEILGTFEIGNSESVNGSDKSKVKEIVRSDLNKVISDPSPGIYVIRMVSNKAYADIKIKLTHYSK